MIGPVILTVVVTTMIWLIFRGRNSEGAHYRKMMRRERRRS